MEWLVISRHYGFMEIGIYVVGSVIAVFEIESTSWVYVYHKFGFDLPKNVVDYVRNRDLDTKRS